MEAPPQSASGGIGRDLGDSANNLGESDEEVRDLRHQAWRAMETLHSAGVLRAIGVSNFEPHHIEQILEIGSVTPAVNQIELHSYLGQSELRDYCRLKGIVVEAYGSVGAAGLLEDPTIQKLAKAHGRSPAQIAIRHALQRGCVALARSVTPHRIRENMDVFDFELTSDQMRQLDALECGARSYWDNTEVP